MEKIADRIAATMAYLAHFRNMEDNSDLDAWNRRMWQEIDTHVQFSRVQLRRRVMEILSLGTLVTCL